MTPEQTRAARGWLGWPQAKLAEAARVGLSTVKDYEAGKAYPNSQQFRGYSASFGGGWGAIYW